MVFVDQRNVKFIELFAGIGGFRYGLERANDDTHTEGIQQGETYKIPIPSKQQFMGKESFCCVYANEINKYACQIYRKNYGKEELHEGDITKIKTEEIPDHDLLTGGFPCQAFSIAGKRLGFDDTRGTLFFEIARILKNKKPRYFLLKNVRGLLSHEKGKTFETILEILSDLGYLLQWEVLNSKNYGVPQNRERVFIIGHLRGTRRPEVFPIRTASTTHNESYGQYARAIDSNYHKGWLDHGQRTMINEINVVAELNSETWKKRHESIRRVYGVNGISQTIPTGTGGGVMTKIQQSNRKIRRLTPIECEKLQGFPDGWTAKGIDKDGNGVGISDTQRYKCLGNAVSTPVITAIGKRLLPYLL